MNWRYIVCHTAAHATKSGVAKDTTAAEIDSWHRNRKPPFRKGGYQRVFRWSGLIDGNSDTVRSYSESGAHVEGMNSSAIGYCFSGHGDFKALTQGQLKTFFDTAKEDMKKYGIKVDNVIGHCEVNRIIVRDGLKTVPPVNKSCPGSLVPMESLRAMLRSGVSPDISPSILPAISSLPKIKFCKKAPDTQMKKHALHLQNFLYNIGVYSGDMDGWPGTKTSDAVKEVFGFYLAGDPRK